MSQPVIVAVRGAAFALGLDALCGSFDASITVTRMMFNKNKRRKRVTYLF